MNPNFHPQWLPKQSKTITPNAIFRIVNRRDPVYSRANLYRFQELSDKGVIAFDVKLG